MELSEAEIKTLLDTDLDALYERAGRELAKQRLGVKPPSREKLIEQAKVWLDTKRAEYCQEFNKSKLIRDYIQNTRGFGQVELFTCIFDVVAAVAGGPAVATCSAIILKRGIHELCPNLGGNGAA